MNLILTIGVDALVYASWLFIVSLGLTLVFGVLKILNMAHGSFYALGAYGAASLVALFAAWGFAPWMSLIAMLFAAVGVAVITGPILERVFLSRFHGQDEILLLQVTYALFLILEDATKLVWGVNPYYVSEPYSLLGNLQIGGLSFVGYDFGLVLIAVVAGLAVWYGLNRTVVGKVVLAVIHNAEISISMGVKVRWVYGLAFTVGVFLAALGGAFTAPMISVQPGLSVGVIIVSFAVVIVGGLGSIEGAAIGALVIGLARALSVHLAPDIELFSVYLVMTAVLIFKPEGLFQSVKARVI